MIVFALNTAFAALDGAILRDGVVLAEDFEPLARGHEQRLPDFVSALFARADVVFSDVTRFAVVTGPGSFTGVRVGVSYMRGLALVTGAPCVGITSLEAAVSFEGAALACLAAKKRAPDRTWWVQVLENGEGASAVEELSEADTRARLDAFSGAIFLDAPEAFPDFSKPVQAYSARSVIAAQKAARFDAGAHPPAPVYAREADANLPPSKP